jgi:hypothetical protein
MAVRPYGRGGSAVPAGGVPALNVAMQVAVWPVPVWVLEPA